ncbi:hypothetical protein SLS62_001574 [Diatrype stigma]|uniref:Perilipin MPL1-like protein n=1 Tax=Diatrype stigma TaxID=117547 RepID=A0AAN9YRK4_9PEZI
MAAQVNGEVHPTSATLSHFTQYPVVSDSLSYIKKNPYGQKSLELSDSAYQTFAKPVIPYFSKPYEYVSPYVKKADSIGDQVLSKVDERLPILKKPTGELWSDGKSIVFFPVRKGTETKDHVFQVYNSEYKNIGGDGLVTYGKAALTTSLIVSHEALNWLSEYLRASKTKAKEATDGAAHS